MKRIILTLICAMALLPQAGRAAYGWFGSNASFVVLNYGAANQYYNLTGAGNFHNTNLGTFYEWYANTLVIKGFENNTYENGGDNVFYGELRYRIYAQSATPPAFSFLSHNGAQFQTHPFSGGSGTASTNSGDNRHQITTASIDVLSGLVPGNYYLEVYTSAQVDWPGGLDNFNNDTIYQSNSGLNHRATFTVAASVPEPGTAVFATFGAIALRFMTRKRR